MSLRTVLQFAMTAILIVHVIGPAAAQPSNPWRVVRAVEAPMPRVKVTGAIEIEFGIELSSGPMLLVRGAGFDFTPSAKPTPSPQARFSNVNGMNFTWQYNGPSIPAQQTLPMPPAIVEVVSDFNFGLYPIGGRCAPPTIFRASPALRPQLIVPGFPYPFTDVTAHSCNGSGGGWWLDETLVSQPVRLPLAFSGMGQISRMPPDHPEVGTGYSTRPLLGACCNSSRELSGTWYREIEGAVFSATFSGDEMKLCMTQCDEGGTVCFTITADYAMTKEGLIHGVVTGVDVEVKRGSHASAGGLCVMPPAGIIAELQKFVDSPFSFRTKTTSAGVMVSNLKFAAEGMDRSDIALVCGMYKPAPNGKVPDPKAVISTAAGVSRCETLACPPVAANPYQPVPTTGAPLPPVSMPVVPAGGMVPPGVPQSFAPPKPMNVPFGDFGVMTEVFGQMLDAKVPPMPAPLPVPTMRIPTPPQIERPR